ncbi:hypothetical protein OH76DRAFT_1410686 [Lentinus brumalis]|uniref:Uncharacterized protein n=1 Tax=Lentinus brumalis TaxID=2498619 RepID=A0A371CRL2_9APHY|nr:hypothetical protein OH76DRAFT_1410686 [Polyporus brumalis]
MPTLVALQAACNLDPTCILSESWSRAPAAKESGAVLYRFGQAPCSGSTALLPLCGYDPEARAAAGFLPALLICLMCLTCDMLLIPAK